MEDLACFSLKSNLKYSGTHHDQGQTLKLCSGSAQRWGADLPLHHTS